MAKLTIPFVDLKAQYNSIKEEIDTVEQVEYVVEHLKSSTEF